MGRTYIVKWKRPGMLFWRRCWRCVGDTVCFRSAPNAEGKMVPIPMTEPIMVLSAKNGARFEIPVNGTMFRYSRNREKL